MKVPITLHLAMSSLASVFNFTHSGRYPVISHCGFNYTSLTNEDENLFVFIGHLDNFFCEVLVEVLVISY